MHISIFLIKHAMTVSVVFGNDVIAAAILNILKSVNMKNDAIDLNYILFHFH